MAGAGGTIATRRRARLRVQAKGRQWLNTMQLLTQVCDGITGSGTAFGQYANAVVHGDPSFRSGLHGHLLPLPVANLHHVSGVIRCPMNLRAALVQLVNISVAGINFLESSCKAGPCAVKDSEAQKLVLGRIGDKWWSVVRHISFNVPTSRENGVFQRLAAKGQGCSSSNLVAHRVDMLDECGNVNVDESVPEAFAAAIHDPKLLFNEKDVSADTTARVRGSRAEYVLLIRRQLRSKKVVLGRSPLYVA